MTPPPLRASLVSRTTSTLIIASTKYGVESAELRCSNPEPASVKSRNMDSESRAVVLLSGGLDSATTLAIAQREGFVVHALSFHYGQRHQIELEAARRIAARYQVAQHIVIPIDLRSFGGSALTSDIAVPKDRPLEEMSKGIPITYVPARNTIFLSFALAWAE